MGVRGLASYFSHRELFFEESVLGDCRVVIDGDNLRQESCVLAGLKSRIRGFFSSLYQNGRILEVGTDSSTS